MSQFEMENNNVGLPVGGDLILDTSISAAPSVKFNVSYNEDFTEIKKATLCIEIPLDTDSALFAPVVTDDQLPEGKAKRVVNMGEVGLKINENIVQGKDELDLRLKQFLVVHNQNVGTLHVEVPLSIAIKRDNFKFIKKPKAAAAK